VAVVQAMKTRDDLGGTVGRGHGCLRVWQSVGEKYHSTTCALRALYCYVFCRAFVVSLSRGMNIVARK